MFFIRTVIGLGLIGLAYYIGREIGRSESARRETDEWRKAQSPQGQPSPAPQEEGRKS